MTQALHIAHLTALSTQRNLPALAGLALKFAVLVTVWDLRHRSRRDLRKLPPHLLRDIGHDAFSAAKEVSKPFWQP